MRPLSRSLFTFKGLVIVTGLAISGLFMISVLAIMDPDSSEQTEESEDLNILPICDKKTIISENTPDILFVSTLDGTLTALDAKNQGKTLWSVGTGPGSMLSSTISQVELTSNAQFVRLIPSLAGGKSYFLVIFFWFLSRFLKIVRGVVLKTL